MLTEAEITFWKKFIYKYLQPLDKDVEKEKKIASDLKVNYPFIILACGNEIILLSNLSIPDKQAVASIEATTTAFQVCH